MSQVCIRGVGCYLPEARLTNQALATRLGVTDDYIVKLTGIRERRRESLRVGDCRHRALATWQEIAAGLVIINDGHSERDWNSDGRNAVRSAHPHHGCRRLHLLRHRLRLGRVRDLGCRERRDVGGSAGLPAGIFRRFLGGAVPGLCSVGW